MEPVELNINWLNDMITGTFELPHGTCQIVFLHGDDDLIQLGKSCGLDDVGTLHNNFVGPRPRIGGSCYYRRRVVFVALVGSVDLALSNLAHELGHQHAFDLGVDPKDEALADMLGDMLIDVYSYDFGFLRTLITSVTTRSKGGVPTQPEQRRGGSPLWLPDECIRAHYYVMENASAVVQRRKVALYVRVSETDDYKTTVVCDTEAQFVRFQDRIDSWARERGAELLLTFEERSENEQS